MAKLAFAGAGNMAEAIITGITAAGLYNAGDILIFDVSQARMSELQKNLGVTPAENLSQLAKDCDALLLAVKPDKVASVAKEISNSIKGKPVISIAAGITINDITAILGQEAPVIRVMPNTPALVQSAASCIAPSENCSRADIELAKKIFSAIGICLETEEKLLNAVTALSGSGPAFCFMFMEALADGGVRAGLPRDMALQLAAATMKGSAELCLKSGTHPGKLKDMVTSPGGTTIAGVAALEKSGLRSAAMEAVRAAFERAVELSKK